MAAPGREKAALVVPPFHQPEHEQSTEQQHSCRPVQVQHSCAEQQRQDV